LALLVCWCADEPERAGEVAALPGPGPFILGRGAGPLEKPGRRPEDEGVRVRFLRQRPGVAVEAGPLKGPGISRQQLSLQPEGGALRARSIGKCPLAIN